MRHERTFHADEPRDTLIAEAADEYERLLENGLRPDLEQFVSRYPQVADVLRRVLPALSVLEQDDTEPLGRELGDFKLRREVGRGGMGVVYEADQLSLNRRVALKVLPFAAVMDPRQLQRFKNEAQAAATLHHGHIVPVYSIGCERGVHYFAMQYIEGPTIADVIEQLKKAANRDMPPSSGSALEAITRGKSTQTEAYCRSVARLGIQAAEALDHAHQQGVVHRDVKPANLIVDAAGHLWITDFGLASFTTQPGLTVTGDLVGTVRYMSPEQALAKRVPIDHRTDIYSLGVTLYELLTLKTAFPGDDPHRVIQDIAFKEPPSTRGLNVAVPDDLETILLKAMAKDPAERFATAQDLADDLERFLGNQPIHARRPGLVKRAAKWARRHRAFVATAAVLAPLMIAILITGNILLARERDDATAQRELAADNLELALQALDEIYLEEIETASRFLRKAGDQDTSLLRRGLEFYETFAQRNRANPRGLVLTGRAYARVGYIHQRLGRDDAAAEAFEEAIRVAREATDDSPQNAEAYEVLALALRGVGDTEGAIDAFNAALELRPDFFLAHLGLGSMLLESEKFEEAVVEAREACRLDPESFQAHNLLGAAHIQVFEPGLAIEALRTAIRLRPEDPHVLHNLGIAHRLCGRVDEAIAAQRRVLQILPGHASAHSQLGLAFSQKGDLDSAITAARESVRLEPDHFGNHYNLGLVLSWRQEEGQAAEAFRESIQLRPDFGPAFNALAWLLVTCADRQLRDADSAVDLARKAVALAPEDGWVLNTLGIAHYYAGDWNACIATLHRALGLRNGGDAFDWFFLSMAYGQLGDVETANEWYAKAVAWTNEHAPENRELMRFQAEATELIKK